MSAVTVLFGMTQVANTFLNLPKYIREYFRANTAKVKYTNFLHKPALRAQILTALFMPLLSVAYSFMFAIFPGMIVGKQTFEYSNACFNYVSTGLGTYVYYKVNSEINEVAQNVAKDAASEEEYYSDLSLEDEGLEFTLSDEEELNQESASDNESDHESTDVIHQKESAPTQLFQSKSSAFQPFKKAEVQYTHQEQTAGLLRRSYYGRNQAGKIQLLGTVEHGSMRKMNYA